MRAIRVSSFGGPAELKLEELADPVAGVGEVVVRVFAAGVNPVDTYVRAGTHAIRPPLPYTPGFDGAGVVESIGAGVRGLRPGDRVWIGGNRSGTYAERSIVPEANVHSLPDHLTFAQGAAVGIPYVTAYRALFEAGHAKRGETALVHGASGSVGLGCVQLAYAAGVRTIGSAGTPQGRRAAEDSGCAVVLDHHRPDFAAALVAATDGRGVDLIIEMAAAQNLGNDLQLLADRGRVVIVGSQGPVQINPRDAMLREATIRGVFYFSAPLEMLAAAEAAVGHALADGTARPVIAQEFSLDAAARAQEAVVATHSPGKIVLAPM